MTNLTRLLAVVFGTLVFWQANHWALNTGMSFPVVLVWGIIGALFVFFGLNGRRI